MAIYHCDISLIYLQKEYDCALVAEIVFEASFDFCPLLMADSVIKGSTNEDKCGNANHIIAGQIDISLFRLNADVM